MNEEESPWEPLHVERGFSREDSTVTVFASWGPRQLRAVNEPQIVLDVAADVASSLGTSLATSDSVSDLTIGVRQGQVVITFAGAGAFWNGWTKREGIEACPTGRIGNGILQMLEEPVSKIAHYVLADPIGEIGLDDTESANKNCDTYHNPKKNPQKIEVRPARTRKEGRVKYNSDEDRVDYTQAGSDEDQ